MVPKSAPGYFNDCVMFAIKKIFSKIFIIQFVKPGAIYLEGNFD